jgi:hypothetical protein
MNWYIIKTKDTYVSKLCIFLFLFVTSATGWGYDWWTHINMDVTLPFLSHRALGTEECDESNEGGTIFGRRGAEIYFTVSHTTTRASEKYD